MSLVSPTDIRNIALIGHGGSGKTSLAEALLLAAGVTHSLGLIEKGNTVADYSDEAKVHKHSLTNTILDLSYQGKQINLIDTPGSGDFGIMAMAALPAVETVALVINAQAGIEPLTRRLMERATERKLCKVIVINKIDAENIDLAALVEQIRETFGPECLPINLPAGGATKVIDVFDHAAGDSDFTSVAEAHTQIIDQVVEVDETLMEKYLETGEVEHDKLHAAFEKALRTGHLVPICFTCARHHGDPTQAVGIKELLDIIVKLFPNPAEGNPKSFTRDETTFAVEPDPDKPLIAHVFKVKNDRFGKVAAFRVHQGKVTKDTQLYVNDSKKPLRTSHIYRLHGGEHREVEAIVAGDLGALVKVDEVPFDGVLHDHPGDNHVKFKGASLPEPMYGLAVTARSRGDEAKIGDALHKLAEEDPTLRIHRDTTTHETVLMGVGEMHLRITLDRLKSKYGVEVDTKPPTIAYRETIQGKAEGHHRHKKQTGGAGQFGEVYLRIEPLERGQGFEFSNDIFGGSIPGQFIPAIEKGIRQVMATGCVAGYPMQDIKVSVYDGKHHPVDSKEVAFVTAGKRAFQDAVNKAKPALLEPIVHVEVTVPSSHMGDITGDLSGKRGRIQGTDMLPGDIAVIKAQCPLSEMTNYQSQLKSVTGGQGSFTMELSHYEPMPPNIQSQIVAQYKPREEED
ncbi:MAG: elongation factor G [Phycisphaeraceae bacterium]|nr:elongation factor G [Phycisphaeraceae bacterium]